MTTGSKGRDIVIYILNKGLYIMKNKKQLIVSVCFMAIIISLLMSSSGLESIRVITILLLITLGMFFGIFIVSLKSLFWNK